MDHVKIYFFTYQLFFYEIDMTKSLFPDLTDQNAPHIKNVPVLHSTSFW